jgi:uracil-DNA glycosylase
MSAASELEKIAREVAVCTKCDLCRTRANTVPGEGSPTARVLFIGEAPGFHEDQQGRPFVGQSGQLLNKLLEAVKLPRDQVFIANVVKCHPPQNLDPTPAQMAACKPYLDRQIAAINPRLIITLGRFSMARYWPGQRISQIHGQPKQADGRLYLPMFHPAAALRDRERTLPMFKQDGFKIPALLEKAAEIARNELWGYPVQAESGPEVPPPLALAETPAPFQPPASPVIGPPASPERTPKPAPGQLTVTAAPSEVALVERSIVVPATEVVALPEKVEVKAKDKSGAKPGVPELSAEVLPGLVAPDQEIAPGLALADAAQGRHRPSAPKTLDHPAKPRKKRPAAPGEQLSMF